MPSFAINVGDAPIRREGSLPSIGFRTPQIESLRGAYILGAGDEIGLTNWAADDEDANPIAVGSPVWSEGFAALSRTNYLDTQIAETLAVTFVCVARRISTTNAPIMGNYASGENIGVAMYGQSGSNNIFGNADRGATGGSATLAGDVTQFRLYSLVVPEVGPLTLRDHTAGTMVQSAAAGARVLEGGYPFRLGSFTATDFTATVQMSSSLIASSAVTDEELDDMVAWCRGAADYGGVTA